MPITIDTWSGPGFSGANGRVWNAQGIGSSQVTFNLFPNGVASGATFLLVGFWLETTTPGTISLIWDAGGTNQAMTPIGQQSVTLGAAGLFAWYGLVNPTPGNKLVGASASGTSPVNFAGWGVSLKGTNAVSVAAAVEGYAGAQGNSSTAAVSSAVAIPTGDMAFSAFHGQNPPTGFPSDGGTVYENMGDQVSGEYYSGAGSVINASTTLSSGTNWGAIITGIKSATVAPTGRAIHLKDSWS